METCLNTPCPHPGSPAAQSSTATGVLLDSETAWNRVQRELFNHWNIPFSDDLEEQLTGLSAHQVAETLARLSYTGDPNSTQEYAQHQHNTLTELARIEADIINARCGPRTRCPRIPQLPGRAYARGRRIQLHDRHSRHQNAHLRVRPLVRTWVSCDDVPHGNPHPTSTGRRHVA